MNFSDIVFPQKQKEFVLKDSTFRNCAYSNIDWGNYFAEEETAIYKQDGEEKTKEYKISNNGLKETYRMLKHEHDQIGNRTEANKFFAKEMEYHMKALKESGNMKDYSIAMLQKEISDFGNDWMKAFRWYLGVCVFGFSVSILLSIVFWGFFDFPLDLGSRLDRWQRFVAYLNPIPKFEEAKSLWYLLVSIIKGVLVYQIVVSLKRVSQR